MPGDTAETQESDNEFEVPGEASGQSAETKLQPFPAGVYRALVLFALIGAGGLICNASSSIPLLNHDRSLPERSPKEESHTYISYRARLHPKATGSVTKERVQNLTDYAICLKKALGYPEVAGPESFISQVGQGMPVKLDFHPNTSTYVIDKFFESTAKTIAKQKADTATQGTLTWLSDEDSQQLLDQPLDCVKDKDDKCLKTWEGVECLLLRPLAEAVSGANRDMYQAENEEMDIIVCTRSDFQQVMAWSSVLGLPLGYHAGKQCPITGYYPGRAHPGNNHHAMGLGLDLANQKKALKYLAKIGVACSPTPFAVIEEGHCALGDKYMLGELMKASKL